MKKSKIKDELILDSDLSARKPGTGIPISDVDLIYGKRAKKDLIKGTMLSGKDLI